MLSIILGLVFLSMPLAKQYLNKKKAIGFDTVTLPSLIPEFARKFTNRADSNLISKTAVPIFTKLKKTKPKTMPVITLTTGNMLVLRGPVTAESMNKLKHQILRKSQKLPRNSHIYLILDTPGGSVTAGQSFIDTVKAVPQKVHTITLFAASMGFHIAQNLNNRYILPTGTLMSHRAKISGIGGELPGELIVRLNHILKGLKRMDQIAANRVGMTVEAYQELIRDEYWVDGFEAVEQQMADRQILVKCSKYLINNKEEVTLNTFFGKAKLEFSKCPLLTAPVNASYEFNTTNPRSRKALKRYVEDYYTNRKDYVKNYIRNGNFRNFSK